MEGSGVATSGPAGHMPISSCSPPPPPPSLAEGAQCLIGGTVCLLIISINMRDWLIVPYCLTTPLGEGSHTVGVKETVSHKEEVFMGGVSQKKRAFHAWDMRIKTYHPPFNALS